MTNEEKFEAIEFAIKGVYCGETKRRLINFIYEIKGDIALKEYAEREDLEG